MALDAQSQTVPLAIMDIVVERHRAPLAHLDHELPGRELHRELRFPFLRQNGEQERRVDTMHRQAEDQREVVDAVGSGYDGSQRHLDACPRGENNPRLEGDDAVGD